jgi:hypothetical protein
LSAIMFLSFSINQKNLFFARKDNIISPILNF